MKGVVAAGHERTAWAAAECLRHGGNAFDAAICGFFAACVCEPILASPGGGGYLMARTSQGKTGYYDFFCDTPMRKRQGEVEFFGIQGDFGTNTQEFHVGMGAVAVPGAIPGMIRIHRELGSMPLIDLLAPSIDMARKGVTLNRFQAYVLEILQPIYTLNRANRSLFGNSARQNGLKGEGDVFRNPDLGDFLAQLGKEGLRCYLEGDFAIQFGRLCEEHQAHVQGEDLKHYRVRCARPIQVRFKDRRVFLPGPSSAGGLILDQTMRFMEELNWTGIEKNSGNYIEALFKAMHFSDKVRRNLDAETDTAYPEVSFSRIISRGTTHLSVADASGNLASLTSSNGEGCGYMVPKTGVILNNMLGEEDLAPRGFGLWKEGVRLFSMMSPAISIQDTGTWCAFGSGGSNRIRTALLQFLVRRAIYGESLEQAITAPRCHLEYEHVDFEVDHSWHPEDVLRGKDYRRWEGKNLFFGGLHAVEQQGDQSAGFGDMRRGGSVAFA